MASLFQEACIRAERQCFEEFVKRTTLPKREECERMIEKSGNPTLPIIAEFGETQYRALQEMWDSGFSDEVVSKYKGLMEKRRLYLFNDGIGIIIQTLRHKSKEHFKDKRVTFRGEEEIIDAKASVMLAHKYFVRPLWGMEP